VRFVNGEYEPVEIKRADLMMLLEGIDTKSVKRLKRYQRQEVASVNDLKTFQKKQGALTTIS